MRPGDWRFGVVLAAVVACWTGAGTAPTSHAPARHDLSGAYQCSISEHGYDYPPFACVIRVDGGRTMLVKLEGSQRFEGEIRTLAAGGFQFAGKFFCPFGDCTHALHGTFAPDGSGAYRGTFTDAPDLVVRLVPGAIAAVGGVGYGGARYGGAGYGGAGYGGRGYGGRRPRPIRRP